MKDQVIINGIEYVPKVIAPEPVKVGRWKPGSKEAYFLVGVQIVHKDFWNNASADITRWNMGNVYQTEDLATKAQDKQLLLVELQDFADRANAGKGEGDSHYTISIVGGAWFAIDTVYPIPGATVFYSYADVASAIAHFGDRLNLLKV